MVPQQAASTPDPTRGVTNYAERKAIALSLLNHREPSQMLCTLVCAAMHGASLMTLAQIEAGRQAVNA